MRTKLYRGIIAVALVLTALNFSARAQSAAFNFQGRLNDGTTAANGHYDLRFKLFDDLTGGIQIGNTISRPNTTVINGVFSVVLNFGSSSFTSGDRYLEIGVRPGGSSDPYIILGARQPILSSPFSVSAIRASFADVAANATHADDATTATSAATATTADQLGGAAAAEYLRRTVVNQGNVKISGSLDSGNFFSAGEIVAAGNVRQTVTANGLVKAMIAVNAAGQIESCYNGFDGSNTGNCGFTVTKPLGDVGVYRIDFGFSPVNRFLNVTTRRLTANNYSANVVVNPPFFEIFTFRADNFSDTAPANFFAVVF